VSDTYRAAYFEDGGYAGHQRVADEGDSYDEGDDASTFEQMQEWTAEHDAADAEAFDAALEKAQERWLEEDRLAREAEQAQLAELEDLRVASENLRRVAAEVGLEGEDELIEAWTVAEKLYDDRAFMPGRDEYERAHAALRAGAESMSPAKDELDAASKFITRRRAPDTSAPERTKLEAAAAMLGLTRGEQQQIAASIGLEAP
jgi:hypothetical protein